MNFKSPVQYILIATAILCTMAAVDSPAKAQEPATDKSSAATKKSAALDPFRKYQPVMKASKATAKKLDPPPIQVRIDNYRTQKNAAAAAHVAAPKPTTALLLNELQVVGIFRTPRGWSAMVEATPLTPKLSFVIYPGESFFDGQLVAIEESRLVFRRETVWTDGRREKSVEIKALRAPSPVEAMTAAKPAAAEAAAPEAAKPATPATPEKQ